VIHPRLRVALAVLWLAGAAIAGFRCVRATARLSLRSGTVFAVVALALTVLALGTLRRSVGADASSWPALSCSGPGGAAWELIQGWETDKTRELHALGVDPTLGIALNLAYSGDRPRP